MPSMTTTIGRGLQAVQVEYDTDVDYDDNGTAHIDIDILSVDLYASAADKSSRSFMDVSGLLTESVYQSLESDCRAHEIAEARKERMECSGCDDDAKQRALAHYSRMAQEVMA